MRAIADDTRLVLCGLSDVGLRTLPAESSVKGARTSPIPVQSNESRILVSLSLKLIAVLAFPQVVLRGDSPVRPRIGRMSTS